MITKEEIESDIQKLKEVNEKKRENIIVLQQGIEKEEQEIEQWEDFLFDENNKFDKKSLKESIKRKREAVKGIQGTIETERDDIEDNLFKIDHLKEKIWLIETDHKMTFYVGGKEVDENGK